MNDSPSYVWYLRPHLAFAACRVLSLPIITAYRSKMPVEFCNGGIAIHMNSRGGVQFLRAFAERFTHSGAIKIFSDLRPSAFVAAWMNKTGFR